MKLNLLPPYVSKAGQSKRAWFVTVFLIAGSVAAAAFMIIKSSGDLKTAQSEAQQAQGPYEETVKLAKSAETIIATGTGVEANIRLAEAMRKQNTVYLDLYKDVLSYMPNFFRVRAITAAPSGEGNAAVRIEGVLYSHQQYADVMLALLRIPGALQVSREGFNLNEPAVPGLNPIDQVGIPRANGQVPLPSDPLDRFEVMLATASEPDEFAGVGGYGVSGATDRGAMPGGSEVVVTVLLQGRNLQTPDPRATIRKIGGAGAAPGAAGATPPPPPPPNSGDDE